MMYLKIAYRNLRRHSRQSLAAILSIAAGFVSIVLFEGYIEESRRMIYLETRQKMMFGDINIEHENTWKPEGRSEPWNVNLTSENQKIIEETLTQSNEIEAWAKSLRVDGLASNSQISSLFFGLGIDTKLAQKIRGSIWYWNAMYGVPLENADFNSVLLGQELGRRLGCVPNPAMHVKRTMKGYENVERPFECADKILQFSGSTASGQVSAVRLKVAGLVDAGMKDLDARWAVMPLEMAQSLANTKSVSAYSITLKNPKRSRAVASVLETQLKDKGLMVDVQDWRDHQVIGSLYKKVTSLLDVFKNFVIVIILCIAVMSVLNTLIKIVKERTREAGTWRCLGFPDSDVTLFFVFEAIMLGLAGSVLGALTSVAMTFLANSLGLFYRGGLFAEAVPFSIAFVPFDYLLSAIVLMSLCGLGSFWAIRQTLKRKISENLIHT